MAQRCALLTTRPRSPRTSWNSTLLMKNATRTTKKERPAAPGATVRAFAFRPIPSCMCAGCHYDVKAEYDCCVPGCGVALCARHAVRLLFDVASFRFVDKVLLRPALLREVFKAMPSRLRNSISMSHRHSHRAGVQQVQGVPLHQEGVPQEHRLLACAESRTCFRCFSHAGLVCKEGKQHALCPSCHVPDAGAGSG